MEQVRKLVEDVLEENTDEKVVALANVTEALADLSDAVTGFGEGLPHHIRKAIEQPLGQTRFFMKSYEKSMEVEEEVLDPPDGEGDQNDNPDGGGGQNSNPDDGNGENTLPDPALGNTD